MAAPEVRTSGLNIATQEDSADQEAQGEQDLPTTCSGLGKGPHTRAQPESLELAGLQHIFPKTTAAHQLQAWEGLNGTFRFQ